MLEYKNAIDILINTFSDLKSIYEEDINYYIELPYVFYESVFSKYVLSKIEADDKTLLIKIFDFVEKILKDGDKDFKELVEVAVIEALYFQGAFEDRSLCNMVGELTKESIERCG